MGKQKSKKVGVGSLFKDAREAIAKRFLNFAVIAIFLVIAFLLGKAYLYRSNYFRLRRVEIKDTFLDQRSLVSVKSKILSSCQGKSVFNLNLKAIAQNLQNSYPDAKDISVTLALPDKLVVNLKLRKPVALVKADKLYPVDEEGVMLPITNADSLNRVPAVEGVQIRPDDRRTKVITSRNLKVAIELLRKIKDVKEVADYGIETVDVRDISNVAFYLKNGIEVRIGGEDFENRLMVLAKTLKDPRLVAERIKYIDLRFGDAIIGPR